MMNYKLLKDPITQQVTAVLRSDGWSIPFLLDNTDYQAYLAWLAEGNVPTPADQPTE
jgi:hypothetical protein